MAGVVNCSKRLVGRSSSAALSLPIRPACHVQQLASAQSTPSAAAALFSTTSQRSAPKKGEHFRTKMVQAAKKKPYVRPKVPLPGERKAFRKRIVLSNTNALEVPGLEEVTATSLLGTEGSPSSAKASAEDGAVSAASGSTVGRMLALPDAVVDQLRTVEAFKITHSFPLFRRPSLLVRTETVDLVNRMKSAADSKEALRLVIDGDRIVGKSILLMQAMTHAFLNDWVVIHIPEAQELTSGNTEYAPIHGTEPTQYLQPVYILKLLQSIQAANSKVLSKYKAVHDYPNLTNSITAGQTLSELISSAREADHAWPVFKALWAELTDTSAPRPPLLISVDGIAHLMRTSNYRSPSFELIHAHDLVMVKFLIDVLGGATNLPNGGAVLAATSYGNSPHIPSLELVLTQILAKQKGEPIPKADPFFRGYDTRVEKSLESVGLLNMHGVNKTEARALMEYWAASGLLRERVDEQAVAGTWTLGGGGVVGEMERSILYSLRP